MTENLIVNNVISVFEGEFKPGLVKPNGKRKSDGFIFFLGGNAEYVFQNYSIKVSTDDLLYLPCDGDYYIRINETTSYICIDFSFMEKGLSADVVHNMNGIKTLFYKFFHNFNNSSNYRIPKSFEITNRIYCEFLKAQNKEYSRSKEIYEQATKYILSNYRDEDFTVERLASELKISTVHLRRIFLENSLLSPIKHINNLRFEQAKALLLSSNLTIGEIASSVGFCDQFYFSKSFKAVFGISPSEYRDIKGEAGMNRYKG